MKRESFPRWQNWNTMRRSCAAEIKCPSAEVVAMLGVMQASAEIQHAILDVLEEEHQLSEGKLYW